MEQSIQKFKTLIERITGRPAEDALVLEYIMKAEALMLYGGSLADYGKCEAIRLRDDITSRSYDTAIAGTLQRDIAFGLDYFTIPEDMLQAIAVSFANQAPSFVSFDMLVADNSGETLFAQNGDKIYIKGGITDNAAGESEVVLSYHKKFESLLGVENVVKAGGNLITSLHPSIYDDIIVALVYYDDRSHEEAMKRWASYCSAVMNLNRVRGQIIGDISL